MNDRKLYLGSSDARDILSGDWDRMYKRKMGLEGELDLSGSFAVQLGLVTEDMHLDWTIAKLNEERGGGFKYSKAQGNGDQHWSEYRPDTAFTSVILGSHPDALLRDVAGMVYPLEAKITGRWKDADEAADYYMPQLQHHMLCWDVDVILFSVVVGTKEPERMWVGASPEWREHYIARCDAFWGHVEGAMPPAPQFFDKVKTAAPIVPAKIASTVPINGWKKRDMAGNNRFKAVTAEYLETKTAVKSHEKAKADLKAMMAEDENEIFSDELVLKRDSRGAIRFTVKEKEAA